MNGARKGGRFERITCKALSLWVTGGVASDCFWRSSLSGGRATVQRRKGNVVRQTGDITAVTPEGQHFTDHWFVECKHVRKLRLSSFILSGTGPLAAFWKKACQQAADHGKHPMIIAQENGQPVIVLVRSGSLLEPRKVWAETYDVLLFDELLKTKYHPIMSSVRRNPDEFADDPAGDTDTDTRRARTRRRKAGAVKSHGRTPSLWDQDIAVVRRRLKLPR